MFMGEELIYSKQLVAFIDILGFSELVMQKSNLGNKKIYDLRNCVKHHILHQEDKHKLDPLNTSISLISDSIVLSTDISDAARGNVPPDLETRLWYFIRYVGSIVLELVSVGLACRGAIVYCDIYHHREPNFNMVVGPALIKAHDLERRIAIYPRILLDSTLICTWKKYVTSEFPEVQESWRNVLKQDQDGEWFLNIFHGHFVETAKLIRRQRYQYDPAEYQKDYDHLKKADDFIREGCKHRDRRVRVKYMWLKALLEGAGEQ